MVDSSAEALQRALERKARGMTVTRIANTDEQWEAVPLDGSPEARLARVTALTRAAAAVAARAQGRTVTTPRSEWPGEVFVIADERARRAPR